jgi:acyl-CoA reductase-like NAD-dependent aldehyde dehydrogenase
MSTVFEFPEAKLFIAGSWVEGGGSTLEVYNKYTQEVVGGLSTAQQEDVEAAVDAASRSAPLMAAMPAWQRSEILRRVSQLIAEQREEIAETIAVEAGKALKFARLEVDRAVGTFSIAAEEATRIHGETVPLDAVPSGEGYFGFYIRRPVGVVAAVAPFNFPLNLVAHKVAPAIAAGNTVVLKPASTTPLTSILLCRILEKVGLPAGAVNLVVGPGGTVGEWLVANPQVAKVTFTGSPVAGERITQVAGIKKVTLELGNTSPVIIASDADVEAAAKRCAIGAYYNSGQVCLSVQRIYGDRRIYDPLAESLTKASQEMVVGDPTDERVDVGPMINQKEAERIEDWVGEATGDGAQILTGGRREGAVYWPTVLAGVKPGMKVVKEETFAPVASVIPYDDFEEALRLADATDFGLQASVFTQDVGRVFQAIRSLNFGGVIINDTPTFRADHMPYGGTRRSGVGREGLRYAIEEMTNIQMVAIRV